jgi:hypothetical protein
MPTDVNGGGFGEPLSAERIPFDYIKGTDFRVMRTDGCIGGATPNGHIHMVLYSERPAIPRRVVHRPAPDGTLGEEIESEKVSRNSLVREMHADLFLTREVAEAMVDWLRRALEQLDERDSIIRKMGE